jgi:hypothetical protein
MSHTKKTVTEPDQDAANILLQTPPMAPKAEQTCTNLFAGQDAPPENGLWVTYTRSPDEKLAGWRNHGSETVPAQTGVIVVGDQSRTTGVSHNDSPTQSATPIVNTVADPTDLTGLSVELSRFFEAWGTNDGQFSICFDSLTPLLVYVSVDRVCRFLHMLTTQVEALGATAHYHLTFDAHDAETVNRISTLFDDVVELSADRN